MNSGHNAPTHIFVVGMPRTGTNLVRNILNGAEQVDCVISPETFFVGGFMNRGGRQQVQRIGNMAHDENVSKLVDAMYTQQFAGNYWKQLANGKLGVDREELTQAILESDRSDRSIYEILLRIPPAVTGSSIVGDKTPAHLFHVPTLLEWFPQAKIVHTFRDPRAIYVSQIKKTRDEGVRGMQVPWKQGTGLFNFSLLMYTLSGWMYAARLHHRYRKEYPDRYFLIQFEQMVTDPEESLNTLGKFLNIEPEPGMLQPVQTASSYSSGSRNSGFDQDTLTRWRGYINPTVDKMFQLVAGRYLREFGYL